MSNVPTEPLTLESLQSSANYKASMEIKDYVQSCNATGDVDETLSEAYRAYGCRNTEMAQKVDEICTKYGLNKVGDGISPDTTEEMFTALDVRSMVRDSGNGDVTTSNPSYSADGNFEFWGRDHGQRRRLPHRIPGVPRHEADPLPRPIGKSRIRATTSGRTMSPPPGRMSSLPWGRTIPSC